MSKILVVRASGGLSNRLQAVAAGVGYCLLTGRRLCVDWRDGLYSDDFSNVFPLWFALQGVESASCEEVSELVKAGCSFSPPFWGEWLPEAVAVEYLFPGNDHALPGNVALSSVDLRNLEAEEDVLVFWGWNMTPVLELAPLLRQRLPHFAELSDQELVRRLLLDHVHPAPDLMEEAQAFMLRHFSGGNAVGIHIRHTDMQSPLDRMLRELEQVAGTEKSIFLCTDNKHVETMVCRLFPRTVVRTKIFQGDAIPLHCHVPGISNVQKGREALLDMLTLSHCRHIIHYARSSFARIPALLSGLPPEYIHSIQ